MTSLIDIIKLVEEKFIKFWLLTKCRKKNSCHIPEAKQFLITSLRHKPQVSQPCFFPKPLPWAAKADNGLQWLVA